MRAVHDDIRCPSCGHTNRPDRRFCTKCGVHLGGVCAACGSRVDPDDEYCGSCGATLASVPAPAPPTPGSPPDGPGAAERRQMTVMFCDLVGSTPLAERLDPEDFRDVVGRYYDAVRRVTDRHRGHVAQYLGDGLLVYFGYPQAHEDDAERAVRAGCDALSEIERLNKDLERERQLRIAARIGVHTGLVVVGDLGQQLEGVALGDTMNLAARIQALAAPDTVLVSADTLRLVRGVFVTEDRGTHALKGIARPVHVHRVVQPSGVRSRLETGGKLTRFIGREQELGLLLDRWEQVLEGAGQTVLISGEAGVGKSRLVLALRDRLAGEAHTWLECHASAYTQSSALQPVTRLLEQGLALSGEDGAQERLRKLEDAVQLAGLPAAETVPLIAHLIGIPLGDTYEALQLSPERTRERTLEVLVAWILVLGEIQPVVLLVEDLHWADPTSLELLGRVVEQIPTGRVLLALTARPEFAVPWSHPKNWTPIALGRLRRRQARELATAVSDGPPLPEEAIEQVIARADGVPLYLEELARAAVESEGAGLTVAVPMSLQDSLMARLDRMSAAKEVAQLAAVLGREFPYGLLAAVAQLDEPALREGVARLVDADLLYQRGSPPAASYVFKHALIQDTAYQSLLKSRRRAIHGRTAAALLARFPERAHAEPEVVACHFEAAGLAVEAATHYGRAGERAAARSAHREAADHFSRGIAVLESLRESAETAARALPLHLGLGVSLQAAEGFSSERVQATYARARSLCEVVRDPTQLARGLWGSLAFLITSGDLASARPLAERLRRHGEETGEPAYVLAGQYGMSNTAYLQGRFAESLRSCDAAIVTRERVGLEPLVSGYGQDFGVTARCYASLAWWAVGRHDHALEVSTAAVERARAGGHPFSLAFALVFAGILHWMRRSHNAAWERASEAVELSARMGFPLWLGSAKIVCGWSRAGSAAAVDEMQEGMLIANGTGNQTFAPGILGAFAEVQHAVGRDADALGVLDAALALSGQMGMGFWDAELRRARGVLLFEMGRPEAEAEREIRLAVDIARSQEARSLELRAATSLARLWQRQGRPGEARALLAPIHAWFTEGIDMPDLQEAKALLDELG